MNTFFKLIIVLIIMLPSMMNAQVFEVETILENGDKNKRINIVFLADGYQTSELNKFITDVNNVNNYMFTQSPFKEYKSYFNVFAIKVPSNESGASHPGTATDVAEPKHPVKAVDNYFGSSFDTGNIHRLLHATKSSKVYNVLASNLPEYDAIIVLVNSTYYGGAGGSFATLSTNFLAPDVALHEIGHSFANLADEYWPGDQYASEKANRTKESNASTIKWRNWLGTSSTGIYVHGNSGVPSQWYRPHQNCKMRYLGKAFCAVCQETFVEKFHLLTNSIEAQTPSESSITLSSTQQFDIALLDPTQTNIKIEWFVNNVLAANNTTTYTVNAINLNFGVNDITVKVLDETPIVRKDGHEDFHTYTANWNITKEATAIVSNDDAGVDIIAGIGGIVVENVLANDLLGGSAVTLADIDLTEVSSEDAGIVLNTATGAINVGTATQADTYELVYKICEKANLSNCDIATATIVVSDITGTENIEDMEKNLSIYPVPTPGEITITYNLKKNEKVELSLLDINGKLLDVIVKQNKAQGEQEVKYNLNNYPKGLYYIQLKYSGKIVTKKVVRK